MTSTSVTGTIVDRFLDAITAGTGIPADLFSDDAVVDATVPGWRFTVRGPEAIAEEYGRWFADPATFEELDRHPIEGGEVVTYFLTWNERGMPMAARHCHVLRIGDDGRILADQSFCGGRWDAALLARMAEAGQA